MRRLESGSGSWLGGASGVERSIQMAEKAVGVEPGTVMGGGRSYKEALSRHVAMYLMRTVDRMSYPEIGEALGRHHSSVMHGCSRIEKMALENPGTLFVLQEAISRLRNEADIPERLERGPGIVEWEIVGTLTINGEEYQVSRPMRDQSERGSE